MINWKGFSSDLNLVLLSFILVNSWVRFEGKLVDWGAGITGTLLVILLIAYRSSKENPQQRRKEHE